MVQPSIHQRQDRPLAHAVEPHLGAAHQTMPLQEQAVVIHGRRLQGERTAARGAMGRKGTLQQQ